MKILILGILFVGLFNATPVFADTAELLEETAFDVMAFWDYAWRIVISAGGLFTIVLSSQARRFLKGLTFDQFQEIGLGIIERLAKTPERAQAIFTGLLSTPFGKSAFDTGKEFLLSRINQIDEHILDLQIKANSGLVDDQLPAINALIQKLQAEKVRLLELHAQNRP